VDRRGDFRPVAGHLSPVTGDPKYPYIPTWQGQQPTLRIADLTNPNPKPAEGDHEEGQAEVLGGKVAFSPSQSCVSAAVPGFLALGGNHNPYLEPVADQITIRIPREGKPVATPMASEYALT
jgi:hypothetical protein